MPSSHSNSNDQSISTSIMDNSACEYNCKPPGKPRPRRYCHSPQVEQSRKSGSSLSWRTQLDKLEHYVTTLFDTPKCNNDHIPNRAHLPIEDDGPHDTKYIARSSMNPFRASIVPIDQQNKCPKTNI